MTGFAGKRGAIWVFLGSWLIPLIMCGAYAILMKTSETGLAGKLWEGLGLGFVLFLWFLFRYLTSRAALTRAVAVGDADRVLEVAAGMRGARRAVYRALAHEMRGDFAGALRELDAAPATGGEPVLIGTVRIAALVETGRASDARAVYDAVLAARVLDRDSAPLARLAEGRVLWAERDLAGAEQILSRLVDDVRAGEGIRATAHVYLARIADARGDAPAATRHRAKATQLAPARGDLLTSGLTPDA